MKMSSDMSSLKQLKAAMAIATLAPFMLAACGGDKESVKRKVEGERISVLSFERRLEVDPRLQNREIILPPAYINTGWTQPGGFASNAMQHIELGAEVTELFSAKFVTGNNRDIIITTPPLIAEGKVFGLGADMKIVAANADTGVRLWRSYIAPEDADIEDGFGGGMAYENGMIYAATGFGEILALDAANGDIKWRVKSAIPFRTAPTVAGGQIYVISHDNQLQVYSTENGRRLWNQLAILEPATILSASSPAVVGNLVVAGFSSGEIIALRANNGTVNWSDSLSRAGQLTPLSDLNPIVGRPVIDRDRVFAVSHGGRMVAVDLRSGERVWTGELTSIETPWVAGDYIFLVTIDAELICLSRNQGRVHWVTQLERYIDGDIEDPISWAGPVLAGGRLWLTSSQGKLVSLSPHNGAILSQTNMKAPIHIAPIVANQTLYILDEKGRLTAYR